MVKCCERSPFYEDKCLSCLKRDTILQKKLYEEAILKKDDSEFQYILGIFYEYGMYVNKDREESLRLLNLSATNGNLMAIKRLYKKSENMEDEKKYMDMMINIADNGNRVACYFIGIMNINKKKYQESEKWFKIGANKGHKDSIRKLIYLYTFEFKLFEESLKWSNLLAKEGDMVSIYNIGYMYQYKYKNGNEAYKMYKIGLELGNYKCLKNIIMLYKFKNFYNFDNAEEAFELLIKQEKFMDCQLKQEIGNIYFDNKKYDEAMKWLSNFDNKLVYYKFGVIFEKKKNYKMAIYWYLKNGEKNNVERIIRNSENRELLIRIFRLEEYLDLIKNPSFYHKAVCYWLGILGFKKNKKLAKSYFDVIISENIIKDDVENSLHFLQAHKELKEFPNDIRYIIIDYYLE